MNKDIYYDGSNNVFRILKDAETEIRQEKAYVRIVSGQKDVEMIELEPVSRQILCVIFDAKLPDEKKQEYARRLGVSPQSLSMYVSERCNFRPPKRDVILRSLLLRRQILEISQIDHILMELKYPGLYENTWNIIENRRNCLLRRVFDFARSENSAGGNRDETEWSLFWQRALCYYDIQRQERGIFRIL